MARWRRGLPAAACAGAAAAWAAWRVAGARPARLRGRTVLITGGSRGLGLLLARRFGAAGSPVAICATDERGLEAARSDLEERGVRVLARRCDIGRADEVERLALEVEETLGPVEVLVNNAGIIQVGPWSTMTREDFLQALEVMVMGAVHATWAVLPGMVRRSRGRIVNITSIGGRVAIPHLLPYSTAKFASVGFSEGLRAELAGTGVRVTTVVPGLMRTGSPVRALFKGDRPREFAWFALSSATPLTSMSAERAARRIVRAARRGEAFVTLSWQAKLLRLLYDLLPAPIVSGIGVDRRLLDLWTEVDARSLPGEDAEPVAGLKLSHPLAPSFATALMNRAARRNLAYEGTPRPTPEHARRAGLRDGAPAGDSAPGS